MKQENNVLLNQNREDKQIKKMILLFNSNKTPAIRRKLISKLSPIILKTPILLHSFDKDIQHDFYLHIIANLELILNKYIPQDNCRFLSWFTIVVMRKFINFQRTNRITNLNEKIYIENISDDFYVAEPTHKYKEDPYSLNEIIEKLPLNATEKKILLLKFSKDPPSGEEDPNLKRKFKKIKNLEKLIVKNQITLLRLQLLLRGSNSEEEQERIISNIKRIKIAKENKEKIIKKTKLCRSNNWVAKQLNLDPGTISSSYFRLKHKLNKSATYLLQLIKVDNTQDKI